MRWLKRFRGKKSIVAYSGRRHSSPRSPQVEALESRLVLSGLSHAVVVGNGEAIADSGAQIAPAAEVSTDSSIRAEVVNGTLQVPVLEAGTKVTVRQFINFQSNRVVEVQTGNHWFSAPADQVHQIKIDTQAADVQVLVDSLVTSPVQVSNPQNADIIFSGEAQEMGRGKSAEQPLVQSASLPDFSMLFADTTASGNVLVAEGEDPGGTGNTDPIAPTITSFSNQPEFGLRRFYGTVIDDAPVAGLTIRFGGIIDGKTTTVNADGTFELIVELPPGTNGTATAQTTDGDGLDSNVAVTTVW